MSMAQNASKEKKKYPVVKKITKIFNTDVTKSVIYCDTAGNSVLFWSEGEITYNNYEKGRPNYTIIIGSQITVFKDTYSDTTRTFLENRFETDSIPELKTCFKKSSGDSLINYLNGVNFSQLFKEKDLNVYSFTQYNSDTIKLIKFENGDSAEFMKVYNINKYCSVEKSCDKKGKILSTKYTIHNKKGDLTDEIFVKDEKDTSYHFRHYYKNNLKRKSFFVKKGKEEIYEKRYYKNDKQVKLVNYDRGIPLSEESYYYDNEGKLEKVIHHYNNTVSYYEYY